MARLDAELTDVNTVIDRAEVEIKLLREYHTRLIADAVTGKLDVRHFTPIAVGPSPHNLEPLNNAELEEELQDDEDLQEVEEVGDAD